MIISMLVLVITIVAIIIFIEDSNKVNKENELVFVDETKETEKYIIGRGTAKIVKVGKKWHVKTTCLCVRLGHDIDDWFDSYEEAAKVYNRAAAEVKKHHHIREVAI